MGLTGGHWAVENTFAAAAAAVAAAQNAGIRMLTTAGQGRKSGLLLGWQLR